MPARQRGSTVRRGKLWGARYYDETGARRFQGGFETKTDARDWLDSRLGTVEALRRGDVAALRRRDDADLAGARRRVPRSTRLRAEYESDPRSEVAEGDRDIR